MRYLGGKARLAGKLADLICPRIPEGGVYLEPFVGGASVAAAVAKRRPDVQIRISDVAPDLIALYTALKVGWEPPASLSRGEYELLKTAPVSALRGFAGYGMSFGGKFFGGYAAGEGRNYAAETRRSLLKLAEVLKQPRVQIGCIDYRRLVVRDGTVAYCDPPYASTTGYAAAGKFDSQEFWRYVRGWRRSGAVVLVSEYSAPVDFRPIWQQEHRLSVRSKQGNEVRLEKVFN